MCRRVECRRFSTMCRRVECRRFNILKRKMVIAKIRHECVVKVML
jgi:hypothetical protein